MHDHRHDFNPRRILAIAIFVATSMLFSFACTNDDPQPSLSGQEAPDDGNTVEVDSQTQALASWCSSHLEECQEWCEQSPTHQLLCGLICHFFPNHPICEDEPPMCVGTDDPCNPDDDDPEYVPCCEGSCELDDDPGPIGYYCQPEVVQCEGPGIGDPCDPEGEPCCPSGPNDPPPLCEPGEESGFFCAPG